MHVTDSYRFEMNMDKTGAHQYKHDFVNKLREADAQSEDFFIIYNFEDKVLLLTRC